MSTRRGFTLVEVLVVVAIIGILAALITVAVSGAMRATQRASIGWQMAQVVMALEHYKAEFGEYPPDMFDDGALVSHVRKRWPRMNYPDGYWTDAWTNERRANWIRDAITGAYPHVAGNEAADFTDPNFSQVGALALWLGGFPNSDGRLSGFYAAPGNPFTPSDTFDRKVFLDLELGKSVRIQTFGEVSVPVIGNEVRGAFVPFVYFRGRTSGGDTAYKYAVNNNGGNEWVVKQFEFSEFGLCVPYAEDVVGHVDAIVNWKNPTTYQLIHPGLDGRFGSTEDNVRVINTGEGISLQDLDNLTNFSDYKELRSILP